MVLGVGLWSASVFAQTEDTREALYRLEETLSMRVSEGQLAKKDVLPMMVVSAKPIYEKSTNWYPTAALSTLGKIFGLSNLRSCEACTAPRLYADDSRLEQNTGEVTVAEIIRLEESTFGKATSKTAVWLDETVTGVSVRIIDLGTSRIIYADNFDARLKEQAKSKKTASLTEELERRQRGDSLTHTFIDIGVLAYPAPHLGLSWVEQWGDTNANLTGFSFTLSDPVIGLGLEYFRIIPQAWNLMIGAKVLLSAPSAVASAITGESTRVIDPLVTGVVMARLPLFRSNYGVFVFFSTNLRVGIGLTLLNTLWSPLIP